MPSERTKGVVLTRTAFGNVLVGPTAEEQDDRERATVEESALRDLILASGGDGARIGTRGRHGPLCRAQTRDRGEGLPHRDASRPKLDHGWRHPLDGANGVARHRAAHYK